MGAHDFEDWSVVNPPRHLTHDQSQCIGRRMRDTMKYGSQVFSCGKVARCSSGMRRNSEAAQEHTGEIMSLSWFDRWDKHVAGIK